MFTHHQIIENNPPEYLVAGYTPVIRPSRSQYYQPKRLIHFDRIEQTDFNHLIFSNAFFSVGQALFDNMLNYIEKAVAHSGFKDMVMLLEFNRSQIESEQKKINTIYTLNAKRFLKNSTDLVFYFDESRPSNFELLSGIINNHIITSSFYSKSSKAYQNLYFILDNSQYDIVNKNIDDNLVYPVVYKTNDIGDILDVQFYYKGKRVPLDIIQQIKGKSKPSAMIKRNYLTDDEIALIKMILI